MPLITILNTPIDFPNSAADPNWAEGIIQFAEVVQTALEAAVSPADVPPQVLNIDAYDVVSNQPILSLQFPNSTTQGAFIYYSVFRNSTASPGDHFTETGALELRFDVTGGTWGISRESTGDASITFAVNNSGQVSFSTTTIGGSVHTGHISFFAKTLEQS